MSCVFWLADSFQAKVEGHHQQVVVTSNVTFLQEALVSRSGMGRDIGHWKWHWKCGSGGPL